MPNNSIQEINDSFAADKGASGLDDAAYSQTAKAKNFNDQLITGINNISDTNELSSQEAQARSQLNDPNYGTYAQSRLNAITSRKSELSAPGGGRTGGTASVPDSPAPGFGSSPMQPAAPSPAPAPAYTPQDDSVASRLPGLLSMGGPLMEKAQGDAMRTANRRGMQNSSIAAGEGVKAALGVAVPIATSDAATAAQKNLAAAGFGYNSALQAQQIQGSKDVAQMNLASSEKVALMGYANQRDLQAASDAAAKERQGLQLTSEEKRAADDYKNRLAIQTSSDAASKDRQIISDAAAKERQGLQLTSDEKRARDDAQNRISLQTLQNDQTTKTGAATMVSNANATYTNYVSSVLSNPNIAVEERNRLVTDAASRRDAEIDLVNSLFGTHLTWGTSPGSGA